MVTLEGIFFVEKQTLCIFLKKTLFTIFFIFVVRFLTFSVLVFHYAPNRQGKFLISGNILGNKPVSDF